MNFEETFDSSYKRVMCVENDFFEVFYKTFFDASPEIPPYFEHSDMYTQKKVMRQSFYKIFTFYATQNSETYIEKIAKKHNKKHLNIKPELYDIWLNSIIETVKITDDEFNDRIELSWRLILTPGIVYMKFMYDK